MPSPFPGMDPYLESPKHWSDFHYRFIAHWCEVLNDRLPQRYAARVEGRVRLVREDDAQDAKPSLARPDTAIMRVGPAPLRLAEAAVAAGPAVAESSREPVILPLEALEHETTSFVEIIRFPEHTLVAVMELLSPWNKIAPGRGEYLGQRQQWIRLGIHLIELDLLIGGKRLPLGGPLPEGDYYAMVSRGDRRPNCEVYAWSVRESPPPLRLPLSAPDPDLMMDIQPILDHVYDRGRYGLLINYAHDALEAPLRDADLTWARQRGCTA